MGRTKRKTPDHIRQLVPIGIRVETGAIRFGKDWPGYFIRGDNCASLTHNLKHIAESIRKNHGREAFMLEELAKDLAAVYIGPKNENM